MARCVVVILGMLILHICTDEVRAYAIRTESNHAPGTVLGVDDTVKITVRLDTEGESRVVGLDLFLGFDDVILEYRPEASGASDYLLREGGRAEPAATRDTLRRVAVPRCPDRCACSRG